jgi:hypothetical protein
VLVVLLEEILLDQPHMGLMDQIHLYQAQELRPLLPQQVAVVLAMIILPVPVVLPVHRVIQVDQEAVHLMLLIVVEQEHRTKVMLAVMALQLGILLVVAGLLL